MKRPKTFLQSEAQGDPLVGFEKASAERKIALAYAENAVPDLIKSFTVQDKFSASSQ